jgi:tetratricopeptide (TPR) repeat protein
MVASTLLGKLGWGTPSTSTRASGIDPSLHYENGLDLKKRCHYQLAVDEFNLAIAGDPEFADAYLHLGIAHAALNNVRRALKAFNEALRIRPTFVEAYVELGNLQDRNGDFIEAIKTFVKAIQLQPNEVELRNGLGSVYFNMGAYAEAIKAYNQAANLKPRDGRAYYGLGLVYLDLDNMDLFSQMCTKLTDIGRGDLANQLMEISKTSTKPEPPPQTPTYAL